MLMPNGFNEAQAFDYNLEVLELGGHILKIMKVEEVKSSTGKDMIKIYLDTAEEDKQPNYYANKYSRDTRENRRWGCIVNQLILDNEGMTNQGFKTFIDAVEKSNNGFKVQWGDMFCACLQNKLVGGAFGREQFQNSNGELLFATKCVGFRTVEQVKKGIPVPKDKLIKGHLDDSVNNSFMDSSFNADNLPF